MTRSRPSRRTLLLGGVGLSAAGLAGAAVGFEEGVLPGSIWVQDQLGLNGEPGRVPHVTPGQVVSGSFTSKARGGVETGWTIAYPPGAPSALPVLVVLHGRGNDHRSVMGPT